MTTWKNLSFDHRLKNPQSMRPHTRASLRGEKRKFHFKCFWSSHFLGQICRFIRRHIQHQNVVIHCICRPHNIFWRNQAIREEESEREREHKWQAWSPCWGRNFFTEWQINWMADGNEFSCSSHRWISTIFRPLKIISPAHGKARAPSTTTTTTKASSSSSLCICSMSCHLTSLPVFAIRKRINFNQFILEVTRELCSSKASSFEPFAVCWRWYFWFVCSLFYFSSFTFCLPSARWPLENDVTWTSLALCLCVSVCLCEWWNDFSTDRPKNVSSNEFHNCYSLQRFLFATK